MPPLLAERAVAPAWDLPVGCPAVVSVSQLPTEPGGHSTSFIPPGRGGPAWVWGPGSPWETVTRGGKVRSPDGPEGSTVVGPRHPTPRGALGRAAKSHGAGRVGGETRELATAPPTVLYAFHTHLIRLSLLGFGRTLADTASGTCHLTVPTPESRRRAGRRGRGQSWVGAPARQVRPLL